MSNQHQSNELTVALHRLDLLTDWEDRPRTAMRVGLEPMSDLSQRLGAPQDRFRVMHVTGTKGKGSVCALIEHGLRRAGWQVSRYASPHVERINERITIGGTPVDDTVLARALARAMDAFEAARSAGSVGSNATWFDVLTVAAFVIFADAGVDWAVVEVGLGGLKDSTNVVHGEVAVITNVELEHTEVLGSTREEIAIEKVGILKAGTTLVTTLAPDDPAGRVAHLRAERLGCQVLRVLTTSTSTIEELNEGIARAALEALGQQGVLMPGPNVIPVGGWLIDANARNAARLPGRKERHSIQVAGNPPRIVPIVLDGAHVPFNIRAVLRDLAAQPDLTGPCIAVVALGSDKDAAGFATALCEHAGDIICTTVPSSSRSLAPQVLASVVTAVSPSHRHAITADPVDAFERAVQLATQSDGWVLVTGSLLLIGELRSAVRAGGSGIRAPQPIEVLARVGAGQR